MGTLLFLTSRQAAPTPTPAGPLIYPVTRGIRIVQRIVIDKSIPVPRLDALALHRHDGIWLRPASQRAVVPAGVEEVQSYGRFAQLTCILPLGRRGAGGVAGLAPGFVPKFALFGQPVVAGDNGLRAQMV